MSAADSLPFEPRLDARRNGEALPRWRGREGGLLLQVVIAVAAVTALAVWDETREARQAIEELGEQQAALASSVASSLQLQVELLRRDANTIADALTHGAPIPTIELRSGASVRLEIGFLDAASATMSHGVWIVRMPAGPNRHVAMRVETSRLSPTGVPAETTLLPLDPQRFDESAPAAGESLTLLRAAWSGATTAILSRHDAARLGLAQRTAVAGIARIRVEGLGPWAVVSVTSAARERDRGSRARWRLLISLGVIASIVSLFARTILSVHKRELQLEREVARSAIERERGEHLRIETRAATMLTLAAGVAHEVGTPLGVIVGRAEQISERSSAEERTRRHADQIIEQANRIKSIVQGLMTVARTGSPVAEPVPPSEIVRGATEAVAWRYETAGVRLIHEVAPNVPSVRGERKLLEHAVVNLLLNACEASQRGGMVRLGCRRDDEHLILDVVDEGTGIDPSVAARVMEPFFTTRPASGGSGVGLAITNEIVQMHRGTLTLTANAPRGTRAELRLPLPESELDGA